MEGVTLKSLTGKHRPTINNNSNITIYTYGGTAAIILLPSGVGLMPNGDEAIAFSIDFIVCTTIG